MSVVFDRTSPKTGTNRFGFMLTLHPGLSIFGREFIVCSRRLVTSRLGFGVCLYVAWKGWLPIYCDGL